MDQYESYNNVKKVRMITWMLTFFTLPFLFILTIVVSNIKILYCIKLLFPLGLFLFHLCFYKMIKYKNVKKMNQDEIEEWKRQYVQFPLFPWLVYMWMGLFWTDFTTKIQGNSIGFSFAICVILLLVYFWKAPKDCRENRWLIVIFLIGYSLMIVKPINFLATPLDSYRIEKGIIEDKFYKSGGKNGPSAYVYVQMNNKMIYRYEIVPKEYEKYTEHDNVEIIVWESPFGFEYGEVLNY